MPPSPASAPEKERVCPEDWQERDNTKFCYRRSGKSSSYLKVKKWCEAQNGTLVTIGSQEENDFVKEIIKEAVWINYNGSKYTNFIGGGVKESVGKCPMITREGKWIVKYW